MGFWAILCWLHARVLLVDGLWAAACLRGEQAAGWRSEAQPGWQRTEGAPGQYMGLAPLHLLLSLGLLC